jgi:hypothetical protein
MNIKDRGRSYREALTVAVELTAISRALETFPQAYPPDMLSPILADMALRLNDSLNTIVDIYILSTQNPHENI